jgi:hypothetical protein
VSTVPEQNDVNLIEQARRQINRLAEEVAHLSEADLAPPDYYGEFLQRVLQALAAPAGAVWLLTQQGNLQLQHQINMREVGLDRSEEGRASHDELLRQALMRAQPGMVPPRSSLGKGEANRPAPGNPTDFLILLAPIIVDKQVAGLVEVWQDPNRGPDAQRGFLQFLIRMAGLAASYTRNHQLRTMVGQQQVWTQLEAFARQIHNSLNPTEVSYVVANEGRRLVECDRISVALRFGKKCKVEAISGADVVEKRSNLVQLQRKLFDAVLKWGEKLVYTGAKDDTLPPAVLHALDNYLAESTSKLLVVLPLRDDREAESKRPARSALMMEAFDPPNSSEQMVARLEVVGKHATTALYNATEYKRIPFRFVWLPVAKVQEGLGGKAQAIIAAVLVSLLILVVAMVIVPYPLKMEAKGQVWPKERAYMYTPTPGTVVELAANLKPGDRVAKGQELIHLYCPDLAPETIQVTSDLATAKKKLDEVTSLMQRNTSDKTLPLQRIEHAGTLQAKEGQLKNMREIFNIDPLNPGHIWLRAPIEGVVLTPDFKEKLPGASVKESQPLLRIGKYAPDAKKRVRDWEIELKIPQKHLGQVLLAFQRLESGKKELDVDILLSNRPTAMFKGKLPRDKVAAEATPNKDEGNETEPVTIAWVRLSGEGIAPENEVPPELLVAGVEARTRIRCGNRAMGYSLFYGVWEFVYEKVVFFF